MKRFILIMFLCGTFIPSLINAAMDDDAPTSSLVTPSPDGVCPAGSFRLATGETGKGFSKQYADLNAVCGSVVPLCEVHTTGASKNLDVLSEKKEADGGYTSIDIFKDKASSDNSIKSLQVIFPLNSNYLHIVVSNEGYSKRAMNVKIPGTHKDIRALTDFLGLS